MACFLNRFFYLSFLFALSAVMSAQELEDVGEYVHEQLDKVWLRYVDEFTPTEYRLSVHRLILCYEQKAGIRFEPSEKGRVGIKIYTNSGAGLSTSPDLVEGVIDFLINRGFERRNLFIIDVSTDALWRSGYIKSRSAPLHDFNGVPVYALDEGVYFDSEWYYDSPLPSQYVAPVELKSAGGYDYNVGFSDDRKSFLPTPLLLDVDFWVNLPVIMDHPDLGINGTLANSTLWNVSNQYRFMKNSAAASAAIAEIAAIPELRRGLAFSIVSLEKMQFMGGPIFNSSYVRSFNEIYLSKNAVALDRLFLEKINRARAAMGFQPIAPFPPVFEYAKSLNLGDFEKGSFEILKIK